MEINMTSPIINYSDRGKEFKYERLFLQTISDQIIEYKGCEYDKLIEKDQSIALAKIIKGMEVNGVPITQFYENELAGWAHMENFKKILSLVDLISKDIFGCFDKNRDDENGNFYKSNNIYSVKTSKGNEYIMPPKPSKISLKMNSLLGKNKAIIDYYNYFEDLKTKAEAGLLPKSK